MNDVLLIDGSNLARRNFHAQDLKTTTNIRTGLVYGLVNSIHTIQSRDAFKEVVVVWDSENSAAKRKAIYPMYKSGRNTDQLADYLEDKDLCKTLLRALGVCQVEKPETECDDIIGYLVSGPYADRQVAILSSDKDFYSLISSNVSVLKPDLTYIVPDCDGRIWFKDGTKMVGIYPYQMVDYKCLVGDSSDAIPGAPQFGVGAAITFFQHNDSARGSVKTTGLRNVAIEGLKAVIPMLPIFRKLVTINTEWGKIETPVRPPAQPAKIDALFELLEFREFSKLGDRIYDIGGTAWRN